MSCTVSSAVKALRVYSTSECLITAHCRLCHLTRFLKSTSASTTTSKLSSLTEAAIAIYDFSTAASGVSSVAARFPSSFASDERFGLDRK